MFTPEVASAMTTNPELTIFRDAVIAILADTLAG